MNNEKEIVIENEDLSYLVNTQDKNDEKNKESEENIERELYKTYLEYIIPSLNIFIFSLFKKKVPQGFDEKVLPLWVRVLEKYNLLFFLSEEIVLLVVYLMNIKNAEKIDEEYIKEKDEIIKESEKKIEDIFERIPELK